MSNPVIGYAALPIIPSFQGVEQALRQGIVPPAEKSGKEAGEKAGKATQVALGAAAVAGGELLAKGITTAFTKAFDVAKALPDLGAQFQAATAGIRIGTGATGAGLDALTKSFENVYQRTPAGMEDVSNAITVLTQRVDNLTGKPLEDLSLNFIRLSRLTKTDLGGNLKGITGAFRQFGVPVDQMDGKLNVLFRLFQQTGVGVDELVGQLNSSGTSLRALGLDFDDSASLIALLGEAGLDASQFTSKFTRALAEAAKEGKPAKQVFQETFASIKNAPNDIIATQRAMDLFGPKGAAMAQAIREGRLSFEQLSAAIKNGDTLGQAAADTSTWAGKMEVLKHKLEVDLKPLADGVFSGMTGGLDAVGKWFDEHKPQIEAGINELKDTWAGWVHDLTAPQGEGNQTKLGDLVKGGAEFIAGPGDPTKSVGENFGASFAAGWDRVKSTVGDIGTWFQDRWTSFQNLLDTLRDDWAAFTTDFATGAHGIGEVLSPIWDGIQLGARITWFTIQSVGNVVFSVLSGLWEAFKGVWNGITEVVGSVWNTVVTLVQDGARTIGGIWNAFTSALRGDWEGVWNGIKQFLEGTVDGVLHTIGGIGDAIRGVVVGAWDVAKGLVNSFLSAWNNFEIPGLHIDLPLGKSIDWEGWGTPNVPLLATGAVVSSPMLAVIGESARANPEIVTPASLMDQIVTDALARHGATAGGSGGPAVVQHFHGPDMTWRELAAEADYRASQALTGRQR